MSLGAANESGAHFSWAEVYEQLGWLPDGGLNIAHEAIDRHAGGPRGDDAALVWIGRHGEREEHTFEDLSRLTSRFGNLLRSLGIEKGDRICTSLGRLPELYVALLGILKAGAVAVPLPAGAGPDAIKSRMLDTRAKVLLTDPETRRSLYTAVFEMFDLQHIVVVNKNGRDPLPPETADLDYDEEMGKAPDSFATAPTGEYDCATVHYAGDGPGAVQAHLSAAQHFVTGRWVMGLDGGDTVWSLAQPATPSGLALGVLAPWTLGARLLAHEEDVDAAGCYTAVERHRVSVLHAPACRTGGRVGIGKGHRGRPRSERPEARRHRRRRPRSRHGGTRRRRARRAGLRLLAAGRDGDRRVGQLAKPRSQAGLRRQGRARAGGRRAGR